MVHSMNFMEYSYMHSSDIPVLAMVALCTDKNGISHIYRMPHIMQNHSASATCLDMCVFDEDHDDDTFYDYLHNYFQLSKCSLNVI